jgi:hypothetical protein
MLPHPNLLKAKAICQQGFFRILRQGFMHGPLRRMEWHHEKTKMHGASSIHFGRSVSPFRRKA